MRIRGLVPSFVCLLAGALAFVPTMAEEESPDCSMCHEEVVKTFRRTEHAIAPGWTLAESCEHCHGPGAAHMESGDVDAIVRPRTLPPRESSDMCLSCHGQHQTHFYERGSIHRLADVGCLDCHSAHSTADALLDRNGAELCSECHGAIAAEFELPRSHPLGDGGPACASCHEPHAARSPRADRYAQTCERCHFETAGPFVYEHDTMIVDGCAACHEVHGSTNRHLLRHETQINLCYECHSATFTPGFHSAPRYANQKCTTCHSAIHGSNSSQLFLED